MERRLRVNTSGDPYTTIRRSYKFYPQTKSPQFTRRKQYDLVGWYSTTGVTKNKSTTASFIRKSVDAPFTNNQKPPENKRPESG